MATQTTNLTQATDTRARLMARVDAFFATLGQGMNAYMHRKSRMDEIEALHAKSDAELAEINPLMVRGAGQGVVAVDALIRLKSC